MDMEGRVEIIEAGNGNFIYGRDLHAFIGIGRSYEEWLDDTILNSSYAFVEDLEYEVYTSGSTKEYYISMLMAGELALLAHGEQRAREARMRKAEERQNG